MLFRFVIGLLFMLTLNLHDVRGDGKCERPSVPHSNSTSSIPLLEDGQGITVTCDVGYSNGQTQSFTSVCHNGTLDPPVPLCYANCNRSVIPHSDATSPTPPLLDGEVINVTCNTGYSNGETRTTTSVCMNGTIDPPIPNCFADCIPRIIPHSNHVIQQPNILHNRNTTITCWRDYWIGPGLQSITLRCNNGFLGDVYVNCYGNCQPVEPPLNGDIIEGSPPFYHGDVVQFRCYENYTLVGKQTIGCGDGSWKDYPPSCKAKCLRPVIPHSDANSTLPLLDHGEGITVTCNQGYTYAGSREGILECSSGQLYPTPLTCQKEGLTTSYIALIVTSSVGVIVTIVGAVLKGCDHNKKDDGYSTMN